MEYRVLGVSSGLGVSLYPFKEHLVANIEGRGIFHTPAREQWRANFGDIPLHKTFPQGCKDIPHPDIIISSPDCGSGSIFRLSRAKVYGDHKKNESLAMFFKTIRIYKPKFFLFENLDGLFKSFSEKKFRKYLKHYRLIIHNESVSQWGNSQITRKRLVIVGVRRDISWTVRKYFKLPHYRDKIKHCKELYGDLEAENWDTAHVRERYDDIISIHARKRMSLVDIQAEWLGRLKGRKRWTVEGGNFSTAPGVYLNLKDDYPATARKANRQFDHNGLTLTPRQLARIQGIPDSFKIYINPDKIGYWINKGRTVVTKTPPYEISVWFKEKVEKALKLINLQNNTK